ncbi:MAG: NAD-dependent epimerase/dehydratase family protein, partial [Candidatus Electrothrix sp. EH2]|nr:NAD-dependent epimerase/dehydratase family protein [Candidatus Electrothrix sp. EH2]
MRVLILGGDGYLGWPTAMYLSSKGHDVAVADNYLRRNLCRQYNVEPLFSPPNLFERVGLWEQLSDKKIEVHIGDCCDYSFLSSVVMEFQPDTVVHYAEQPSAPFSMLNYTAARLTLNNNLQATQNIAWAMHEYVPECHLIKLGTMGVYGTPDIDIEEGWIDIHHKGRQDRFLFPRQASSFYHTPPDT